MNEYLTYLSIETACSQSYKKKEFIDSLENFQKFKTIISYSDIESITNDLSSVVIDFEFFPLHKLSFKVINKIEKKGEIQITTKIGIDLAGFENIPDKLKVKLPTFPVSFIIRNDQSFSTGVSIELKLSSLAKKTINRLIKLIIKNDNDSEKKEDLFEGLKNIVSNLPNKFNSGLFSFQLKKDGLYTSSSISNKMIERAVDEHTFIIPLSQLLSFMKKKELKLDSFLMNKLNGSSVYIISVKEIAQISNGLELTLIENNSGFRMTVNLLNDSNSEIGIKIDVKIKNKDVLTSEKDTIISNRLSSLLEKWFAWVISTFSPLITGSKKIKQISISDNGSLVLSTK